MSYINWDDRVRSFVFTLTIFAIFFTASTQTAESQLQCPRSGAIVDSITEVGENRYTITGTALDNFGDAACALALASGRCMFTCGQGSLRCEGGTANLPFGRFELRNLALESNGTIVLQIFVQGNISFTSVIDVEGEPPPDVAGTWITSIALVNENCSTTLEIFLPPNLEAIYELNQNGTILSGTLDGIPASGSVQGNGDFVLNANLTESIPGCTVTGNIRDTGNFINGSVESSLTFNASGAQCAIGDICNALYRGSVFQTGSASSMSESRQSSSSSYTELLKMMLQNQLKK